MGSMNWLRYLIDSIDMHEMIGEHVKIYFLSFVSWKFGPLFAFHFFSFSFLYWSSAMRLQSSILNQIIFKFKIHE